MEKIKILMSHSGTEIEGQGVGAATIEQINLIINRISVDMVKKGDMIDIDTIINTVAVPLIGAVPESSEVIVSNNKGRPIVLSANSYAGKAFLNIAKRITGEKVPILKEKKRNIYRLLKKWKGNGLWT